MCKDSELTVESFRWLDYANESYIVGNPFQLTTIGDTICHSESDQVMVSAFHTSTNLPVSIERRVQHILLGSFVHQSCQAQQRPDTDPHLHSKIELKVYCLPSEKQQWNIKQLMR